MYLFPGNFQIFIRRTGEQTLAINDMKQTNTVEDLKEKVYDKTGYPQEILWFTYGGKPLYDEYKTLYDYGIGKYATIEMFIRPKSISPVKIST